MILTSEQRLIQDTARQFAGAELAPFAGEWDVSAAFPREAIRKLGELGFMGMLVPAEWGGAGLDYTSYLLALIEIAAGDGSCSTVMAVNNSVVCMSLLQHGSEELKKEFLIPLAQGKILGAFALTEPQAGSDAKAIQTSAVREGDSYILKGVKQFVTSGKNADVAIVIAITDAHAEKPSASAFLVPTKTVGYEVMHIEHKMGQHASDTAQIGLNQCKIPAHYLLGKEGDGFKIAFGQLEAGRLGIAAQSIGMAQAALQCAKEYALQRNAFGKALVEHEVIAFRLADMATELEAARSLLFTAAEYKDNNLPSVQWSSMAKLYASEMAERVTSHALQTLGGYGYLQDFPIERIYRDVRVTQIYEGTSEVQRLVISREFLK
jgi:butyryl-CoA dehydrogenase